MCTRSEKISRGGSAKEKERKEEPHHPISGYSGDVVTQDVHEARVGAITSGDEYRSSSGPEKPSKKHSIGARLSFIPKRGSASSTTYTLLPIQAPLRARGTPLPYLLLPVRPRCLALPVQAGILRVL